MKKYLLLTLVIMAMFFASCKDKTEQVKAPVNTAEEQPVAKVEKTPPIATTPKKQEAWKKGEPVKIDLFVSSLCKFAVLAEDAIFKVTDLLPLKVKLELHHVNKLDDQGNLMSMFGSNGLLEDLRQTCIKKHFPDKVVDFLKLFNDKDVKISAIDMEAKVGIDDTLIKNCVFQGEGDKLLKEGVKLRYAKRVKVSPTLYINDREFTDKISSLSVLKEVCLFISDEVCDNVPEYINDSDGQSSDDEGCGDKNEKIPGDADHQSPGHDSTTTTPAKSKNRNPAGLKHYVITVDSKYSNMNMILTKTKELFPEIDVELIDYKSKRGKEMIDKYKIKFLPAYIFAENIGADPRFDSIERVAYKVADAYLLRFDSVRSTFAVELPPKPGKLDLLISSFSEKGNTLLPQVLDRVKGIENKNITFHYEIFKNEKGGFTAPAGQPELEENIRRLLIARHFPDKLTKYLKAKSLDYRSSYWEDAVISAGIDPKKLKKFARDKKAVNKILEAELDWLIKRNINDDFAFYINNNEAVYFNDKSRFEGFISFLNGEAK